LLKFYTSTQKDELVLRRIRRKKAVVPKFVKQIYDEFTTEYNISEVEFKRLMDAQKINLRKLRNQQIKEIKTAVENALKAERQFKKYMAAKQKKKTVSK